jgi:hypothetical protein
VILAFCQTFALTKIPSHHILRPNKAESKNMFKKNKIILITGWLLLLAACTQNVTLSRTPVQTDFTPFISSGDKQIIELGTYKYRTTSSIVSSQLSSEEMTELCKLKAAKTALEYFRQSSVDSAFLSLYSQLYDHIQPLHLQELQAELAAGLIAQIEQKEISLTTLPSQTIQIGSFDITITPPRYFSPQVELFVDLNQTEYVQGDSLKLFVQTNLPAYLTILHIRPDGVVTTIQPRQKTEVYQTDKIHIFQEILDYQVQAKQPAELGYIKIFASTEEIDFALLGNLKGALKELLSQMQALEGNQLTELDLEYKIFAPQ